MVATMNAFRTNLDELERRSNELDHMMADPAVATDPEQLMDLGRERSDLEQLVGAWRTYQGAEARPRRLAPSVSPGGVRPPAP